MEGINFKSLEVVVKGQNYHRNDIDLVGITLSLDGRELMLDIVQSYSDEIEDDGTLRILCDIALGEDSFGVCDFDLTKEDLLGFEDNNLSRTLYVGGDVDFEVLSTSLLFEEVGGQHHLLLVDEQIITMIDNID
jgi:hypothetical protein